MVARGPDGLTDKQRAFIDEYISNGSDPVAAYRVAYNSKGAVESLRTEGHRMLRHPQISLILTERKKNLIEAAQKGAERHGITKAWVAKETKTLYEKAFSEGHYNAAKGCLELMAKLFGFIVERKDIRVVNSLEDLRDQELDNLIMELEADAVTYKGQPALAAPREDIP